MTANSKKKSSVKKSAAKKSAVKKSAAKKKTATNKTARNSATKNSSANKNNSSSSVAKKSPVKKRPVQKNKKPKVSASDGVKNKIMLNAVLAINDANILYAELHNALETKKDISIDASSVEMVDTAVLQMLLAFIKKTQICNVAVSWINPSKDFLNRSETLNLTEMLGLSGSKV